MEKQKVVQVNIKCPIRLIELIDQDNLDNAEYRNRSEWILAAIRHFEEHRTKLLAERKAAESGQCDFTPSGSLHAQDGAKGRSSANRSFGNDAGILPYPEFGSGHYHGIIAALILLRWNVNKLMIESGYAFLRSRGATLLLKTLGFRSGADRNILHEIEVRSPFIDILIAQLLHDLPDPWNVMLERAYGRTMDVHDRLILRAAQTFEPSDGLAALRAKTGNPVGDFGDGSDLGDVAKDPIRW